eukprot:jgi/Mesen1/4061/ME000213S03088
MALSPFTSLLGDAPFLGGSLLTFPDEFSTLFDAPTSNFVKDTRALANTAVDVKETPTSYNFIADLPGLKREEVKVQIEDDSVLSISGKRQREAKQETDKYHRIERSVGSFQRRFRLPENADTGKISAACQNGVLTVSVSKKAPKEPEKPKVIDIQVQGTN